MKATGSVVRPSFWKAKYMMTPPPRIRALPWIRSAQAQAFRPPAVTYTMAIRPITSEAIQIGTV